MYLDCPDWCWDEIENSDDGYDAARDAYLTDEGFAFTDSQMEEDRMLREEYRRSQY